MKKNDIMQFLEAIDEELAKFAGEGEKLDLYLIGRSALILRYGLTLATKDVDLVTQGESPPLQARAFELFGKGTSNAQKWGLYLEGVPAGLPPVPGSYRTLSAEIPGNVEGPPAKAVGRKPSRHHQASAVSRRRQGGPPSHV